MNDSSLALKNITLMRGDRLICRGLNLSVSAGEMIWLRGENGSGKTSLLRALAGFLPPLSGVMEIAGNRWMRTDEDLPLLWHGHRTGLAPSLSGLENLKSTAQLLAGTLPDFSDPEQDRFHIAGFCHLPVRNMSFGQRQRLALSRLLISRAGPAALWLLDEPNSGLDGASQQDLDVVMNTHLAQGGRIIIASHLPLQPRASLHRFSLDTDPPQEVS